MKTNFLLHVGFILLLLFSCARNYDLSYVDGYNVEGGDSVSIDIDTSMSIVDKSKIAKAKVYPGLVDPSAPRLQEYSVDIDISVLPQPQSIYRISYSQLPSFSVGLYAGPGELIKVVVPEGVYGLSGQIGVHLDDLSNVASPRRDPIIYTKKAFAPGVNYIRNPYGGLIWINAKIAYDTPVKLIFSGAVKAPDYILNVSDPVVWRREVLASKVPWLEMRSPSVAFSVPTERVKNFLRSRPQFDPRELMDEWELIFGEDYYDWMGFENNNNVDFRHRRPRTPNRLVLDIHPRVGAAHAGSAVVAQDNNSWFSGVMDIRLLREADIWGIAHEFGHNNQQGNVWSWGAMIETTCNLFIFKIANRYGRRVGNHPQIYDRFPTAVRQATERGDDILNNVSVPRHANHYDAGGNPFYRIAPFVQIYQKLRNLNDLNDENFGWRFMTYIYRKSRTADFLSISDNDKIDFFYESLCEYGQQDFRLFFDAWAIKLSNYSKERMAARYPRMQTKLWEYHPLHGTGGDALID